MLQKALQSDGRDPGAEIVWFNAWQYSQREALWRALLSRVLEALRPKVRPTSNKDTRTIDRSLDDLQSSLYGMVERQEAGGFEVDWAKLAKGSLMGGLKVGLSFIPGGGLVKQLQAMADNGAESSLGDVLDAFRREKTRVRLEQVQFLEQFRDRFQRLVEQRISKKGKRLVVLIDDLDRCMPETAIEVLEAVKLFLDVPGCVFVVAVDRKVIVEGIRVRYRDFALATGTGARLPIRGEDFLEKIIQQLMHGGLVRSRRDPEDGLHDWVHGGTSRERRSFTGSTGDRNRACGTAFILGPRADYSNLPAPSREKSLTAKVRENVPSRRARSVRSCGVPVSADLRLDRPDR
jgi:hypothetical protein